MSNTKINLTCDYLGLRNIVRHFASFHTNAFSKHSPERFLSTLVFAPFFPVNANTLEFSHTLLGNVTIKVDVPAVSVARIFESVLFRYHTIGLR